MWLQRYMVVEHKSSDAENPIFFDHKGNLVDVQSMGKISYVEIDGITIGRITGGHPTAKIMNQPPHHTLVGGYQSIRLDKDHIMVTAEVRREHIAHLDNHEKISLFPSLHSSAKLLPHLRSRNKHKHHAVLITHGVLEEHNVVDAVTHLADKLSFSPLYPDR